MTSYVLHLKEDASFLVIGGCRVAIRVSTDAITRIYTTPSNALSPVLVLKRAVSIHANLFVGSLVSQNAMSVCMASTSRFRVATESLQHYVGKHRTPLRLIVRNRLRKLCQDVATRSRFSAVQT